MSLWRRKARGAPLVERGADAAICTIASGEHARMLRIAIPRIIQYGAVHGFDVHAFTAVLCPSRPAAWSKLLAVQSLLHRYELVWWIDADTLLVDLHRNRKDEIDRDAAVNLVQHAYDGQLVPNAGVMAVRRCPEAFRLIDLMWESTEFIDHPWWENAALISLIGYDLEPCGPREPTVHREAVHFISNDWNSIEQDPAAHPALLHYPALPHAERLARMNRDAATYAWA